MSSVRPTKKIRTIEGIINFISGKSHTDIPIVEDIIKLIKIAIPPSVGMDLSADERSFGWSRRFSFLTILTTMGISYSEIRRAAKKDKKIAR